MNISLSAINKSFPVSIDICILTYKREELLKKLLDSLMIQRTDNLFFYQIIIVDNDSSQSARQTVETFALSGHHKITYLNEPVKNIAIARNRAIAICNGDYFAFIDDDEYADREWIYHLYQNLEKSGADAVIGQVIPYYAESVSSKIIETDFFVKKSVCKKKKNNRRSTSNCLIKRDFVMVNAIRFRDEYGLSGGEDKVFFNEFERNGGKIINSDQAKVYEYIDTKRGNLNYMLKRSFNEGYVTARIYKNKHSNTSFSYFVISRIRELVILVFLLLIFPLVKPGYFYLKLRRSVSLGGVIWCMLGGRFNFYD
ncbi:MAG: glycosyltransferase family 2 protein [Candidatus Cloacimonetes bacterium]|nr:glycosyltransferase family 2 protein [Candidatus Cloacimonadota bacterium]